MVVVIFHVMVVVIFHVMVVVNFPCHGGCKFSMSWWLHFYMRMVVVSLHVMVVVNFTCPGGCIFTCHGGLSLHVNGCSCVMPWRFLIFSMAWWFSILAI